MKIGFMVIFLSQKGLKTFKSKNLNDIILVSFFKNDSFWRYKILNNTYTNLVTVIPFRY